MKSKPTRPSQKLNATPSTTPTPTPTRPIRAPSRMNREEIWRRLHAQGSQQADLARALVDRHQQQVEDADPGR